MYKTRQVKFEDVPNMIESLKGVSGLYIFHTKRHLWYIGKAECFRNRFINGYLKGRDAKQHVSDGILQRIELGLDLSVIFVLIPKELIESEEKRIIHKACPWLNQEHNPRVSIRGIQRHIGQIVEDSQSEWSYERMRKHLFYYYSGQIATKRIEEALANKNSNLSRYCGTVPSQGILKPKKNSA
ncbi:hypothetical protein [Domibacillus aminovorans]|uniref:GIY-YIG domain-containing protein n=1 Tax=Domibacillus aminovorans TaxID=29332 RepID=A0A177LFF0_9BACI|nr:hypothetical protein [Domibacillus aminovorans]OAH63281.1 hypothetical protein AWH49_00035 [Domibacillus aminovorans]